MNLGTDAALKDTLVQHALAQVRAATSQGSSELSSFEKRIFSKEHTLAEGVGSRHTDTGSTPTTTANETLMSYLNGLDERRTDAKARLSVVEAELKSAESVLRHLETQQKGAEEAFEKEAEALRKRYIKAQNIINEGCKTLGLTPATQRGGGAAKAAASQLDFLRGVLAEQELEVMQLDNVLEEAQRVSKAASLSGLSGPTSQSDRYIIQGDPRMRIILPSSSCSIPIRSGRLRRLTGADGGGLQALRQKYCINIRVVDGAVGLSEGRGLLEGMRVELFGHANGVRCCAEELTRLLE